MAIRAAEREGKRHAISLRVTARVRKGLEDAASASGRSMTQEAELRLEQSFEDEVLASAGAALLLAMRKVTTRVLRASRDYDEISDGTPLENEEKTRRELRAALDFIARVYTTTGEPLPAEFSADPGGLQPGEWGSGDVGRLHAQVFLDEWADDPIRLARARSGEVDFYWTPGPPQRSLESIMAEKDGGRDRNAALPARLPDNDADQDGEFPFEEPAPVAAAPKRKRRATPKA